MVVSTKLLFDQTIQFIGTNIDALNAAQRKIASGQNFATYDEFGGGDIIRLKGLESAVANFNSFEKSISRVTVRLQTIDSTLNQIIQVVQQLRDDTIVALNPGNEDGNINLQATSALDQISEFLNAEVDGLFLFSGTKSDTQPVDPNLSSTPNYNSSSDDPFTYNSNYYSGDNGEKTIRISSQREIGYGYGANNDAFQKLIAGAHLIAEGGPTNDEDLLDQGMQLLNDAIDALATLRADNGNNLNFIENAQQQNSDAKIAFETAADEIQNADIIEASIVVSLRQTVLQATFQTFSTISSLKLADFIR